MRPPSRRMVTAVGRAIASASLGTLTAQARAALEAAEPHIDLVVADAVQAERMSASVIIATRERSAVVEGLSLAASDCQKVARERRRALKMAEANGALACVEQVRARLAKGAM